MTGRIARIARSAVHDGPGVRTVVYFKGCPLRCAWCHSPETQASEIDLLLHPSRCIRCGACLQACERAAARLQADGPAIDRARCTRCTSCVDACPTAARERQGGQMDADAVMDAIRRDVPFYDRSRGGVTFSGGEPLMQPSFLVALLDRCSAEGIHAAVETCGHAPREAALRALTRAPLFLYDVKLVDNNRHRAATGASNAAILANLRELAERRADVVIRLTRVDVLPYHRAGVVKYARLGRAYRLEAVRSATAADTEAAATLMREVGLDVRIGGSS